MIPHNHKDIDSLLKQIDDGKQYPWWVQSELLDAIEKTRYWKTSSDSFCNWITQNAYRFGVKQSMLWRRLSAGRYMKEAQEKLRNRGIFVSDPEDCIKKIGPESFELLAKLERAVPQSYYNELAPKVFAGDVKRIQLKSLWETYRPVLGGQTARGRGGAPPPVDITDPHQSALLTEAMTLEALKAAGPGWTGHHDLKAYQIFLHVSPEGFVVSDRRELFSAVAVVKTATGKLEFHGFRNMPVSLNPVQVVEQKEKDFYDMSTSYCDFVWMIYPLQDITEPLTNHLIQNLPKGTGLVLLREKHVSILKKAPKSPALSKHKCKLITTLFTRMLGGIMNP